MKSSQALGKIIYVVGPDSGDVVPAIITKVWSELHVDTIEPGRHLSVSATAFDAQGGVTPLGIIPVYHERASIPDAHQGLPRGRAGWVLHEES